VGGEPRGAQRPDERRVDRLHGQRPGVAALASNEAERRRHRRAAGCQRERGGRVDRALTSYVKLQDVLPALVVSMLVLPVTGESLSVVVVISGFGSRGSVARIVARGPVQEQTRTPTFPEKWWIATGAALSLAAIVAAFEPVGDAFPDAEDPRALDR
jgi:ABC-type dipeptide/oligopeptide/nickel transport system permease subunit